LARWSGSAARCRAQRSGTFYAHVLLHGRPAPVFSRACRLGLDGKINPDKPFDLSPPRDQVAEGSGNGRRRAIKTLLHR
jgi:hypothetical protein